MEQSRSLQELGAVMFANSYSELVDTADLYFGTFGGLSLLLALWGWYRGAVQAAAVWGLVGYLVANLSISQLGVRLPVRTAHRLELFRVFVLNGVFCPLLYVLLDGPLAGWWQGFLIMAIGSQFLLGLGRRGVAIMTVYGIVYFIATAMLLGPSQPVERIVLQAATIALVALILSRITAHLYRTQYQLVHSEKLAALGEMASGLAHEINNPLAIIKLNSDLMLKLIEVQSDNPGTKEELRKQLREISSTCTRISGVTGSLRQFARQASNDPLEEVKVKAMVESAIVLRRELFRRQGVSLDSSSIPEGLVVRVRSAQVIQILVNLLNNALDAALGSAAERWVRIEAKARGDNGTVEISVIDSGPGLSPKLRARIFHPFVTTKDVGKGSGLGLSVAKGLAAHNGGDLFLGDRPGPTRFVLKLPR